MSSFLENIAREFGKSQDTREVLEEDEYLKRLEQIIIRDYYPHLRPIEEKEEEHSHRGSDDEAAPQKDTVDDKGLRISDFLKKYISEDDQSFGDIMEKEKLGFIAKNFDLFKFLRPGGSGSAHPRVGYQMTRMALQNQDKQAILGKRESNSEVSRRAC